MPLATAAVLQKKQPKARIENPRNEAILEQLPLVRSVAARVRESLPVQVELDDLIHAGVMGLIDAFDKYDSEKNVAFHLYAKHRIRGAILDSLRQLDWASRDSRKRFKSIEAATQEQAQRLGRAPEEAEVADALGLSQAALQRQKRDLQQIGLTAAQPHRVEKPEHTLFLDNAECAEKRPDQLVADGELSSALQEAMLTLPPRYQAVIGLYYSEDRTMKEIGEALGVNESRVSQIHKSALEKLGVALRRRGYAGAEAFLKSAN